MVTGTMQNGRARVKNAAAQIIDENDTEDAVEALRGLLYDLALEAQCADMSESYDIAVDAAEEGKKVKVARALVGEVAHSGTDGAALTRLAVKHAVDAEELYPEPPSHALDAAEA